MGTTGRKADLLLVLGGRPLYVEETVIGESQYQQRIRERAWQTEGVASWSGDPQADAFGIVRRVATKAKQAATGAANVLCLSFADSDPPDLARRWAFELLLAGERFTYNPRQLDDRVCLTDFHKRVDSIWEFCRASFVREHVNPHATRPHRLTAPERAMARSVFEGKAMMIR